MAEEEFLKADLRKGFHTERVRNISASMRYTVMMVCLMF